MNYKEEFQQLVDNQKYEDARVYLEENHISAFDELFYLNNMGWVLNHIGRCEEAIAYLQKASNMSPDDAWVITQLGYSYNHTGNHQEAIRLLEKGLSLGHDEAWIHSELGWCYRQTNDLKKAVDYFENALMEDEQNAWILAQAAFCYRDLEKYDAAEEYLKKAYFFSPDEDSLYDLAIFYRDQLRYEDELNTLSKVTANPESTWILFEQGYACNRLERYQEAKEAFMLCLERKRDDTGVREELGDALGALNEQEKANMHYDIALGYYEKAIKQHKEDSSWILRDMVWIAHKENDLPKKLKYLNRLNKVTPNYGWAMYHYAKVYSDMQEYKKAVKYCDLCIQIDGEDETCLSLKAWNLGKLKKYKEAIVLLDQIKAMGREDTWIYAEYGWDYSEVEEYQKAVEAYEKTITLGNKEIWIYSQVGWNCGQIEQYEKALTYLFEAVQLGRCDGWIYATIGWCYNKLARFEEAMSYFDKAKADGYEEDWFQYQMKAAEKALQEQAHEGT